MLFVRLALVSMAAAAVSYAAPIITLLPGESVNATLRVPLEVYASNIFPRNSELTFMASVGGIVIQCTNCAGDPIRSLASFVWDGLGGRSVSNYYAYVPNPPFVETYHLTLRNYAPIQAPIFAGDPDFKIVENPEPSTWLLIGGGLAALALRARSRDTTC